MNELQQDTISVVLRIIDNLNALLNNIGDERQADFVRSTSQEYDSILDEYRTLVEGHSKSQSINSRDYVGLTLKLIQSAHAVAIGITYLSESLPSEFIKEANQIVLLCVRARESIRKEGIQPPNTVQKESLKDTEDFVFKLENRLLESQEKNTKYEQQIKNSLVETETRIEELNKKSDKIASSINEQIDKANEVYANAVIDIVDKQEQINDILGHVSGRAIAGDYETNSSDEKKIANTLRYGSLTCMLFIVLIVGYSFWETTQASFQWEQSIFRVALAAILSVPAAYLARESAKHREQQYNHLQTSLNLKTLSPYIASLPEPEQHRIKAEVAQRLFSSKDFSRVTDDSYPLNTHELIMELLKKIDPKK
ncbi:hypothetical protein AB6D04_02070 [Vibrio splendidus]|uniref:hypothetical protein n=1 Tax=Vibrio splendidus TaxID=29497 RepID=UPI000C84CBF2|nr:hypothetical protein [Vibrio splendidus]PMN82833.1 hypothetical protein BCT24_12140 [Vibrio splendidus]